tara:strand:- start:1702 stop:2073 length:372 start_codon:yes stop_codon:yes gene_type:complete
MATLIPKLSLTSEDYLSDPLNLTSTYRVDVISDPTEFGRASITTATSKTIMPTNSSYSYVYIKVLEGTNKTDTITITIGTLDKIKLRVGEFFFLPLFNAQQVKAIAIGGTCKVEYGYWSRSEA